MYTETKELRIYISFIDSYEWKYLLMTNLCRHIEIYIFIDDKETDMFLLMWMKICFSLCSITEEALLVSEEKSRSAFK